MLALLAPPGAWWMWIRQNSHTYSIGLAPARRLLAETHSSREHRGCLRSRAKPPPLRVPSLESATPVSAFLLKRRTVQLGVSMRTSPPVTFLFLWVFEDFQRLNSLFLGLGAIWRCVGKLQFLRGG